MPTKPSFILVTGASSGIGRAISISLSSNSNLILAGRREEKLQETRSLCCNAGSHCVLAVDLGEVEKIEEILSNYIIENDVVISHFIHCAGVMRMLPLKSLTANSIAATFSVNVTSAALISKVLTKRSVNASALKGMVFISSNISDFGAKAFSIYAASKAALDSLMRCLAVELAPNIRVNSVLPGAIHTEMTESIFENEEVAKKLLGAYPLGLGNPGDISDMVDFLISNRSRWITGQTFVVDGGSTVNMSA